MKDEEKTMEKIMSLCKSKGIIFPGNEIYGGLLNTWDCGSLGVEIRDNIKRAWWKKFIQQSPHNVGLDAAIPMNPQTWAVSGHVGGFSDPLIDCKERKSRFGADKLIEDYFMNEESEEITGSDGKSEQELLDIIEKEDVKCSECGKHNFTDIRKFNLMFKTFRGVTEDDKSEVYLGPETAQGIFTNFRNVQRTPRKKVPFGIGQIGKPFRNGITPGSFIFRTREFEQMELEFFCKPGTDLEWFDYWRNFCKEFLLNLGIREENLRLGDHSQEELSFYSKATTDFEYLFPFGWEELWGIADKTSYDLSKHSEDSGEKLEYMDPTTNEKYTPYCIESSVGVDRMFLSFLYDAYDEEQLEDNTTRTVLKVHPALTAYKVAVLPLTKKLNDKAMEIYNELAKNFMTHFDDIGSIDKRYRREDEAGTPYCVAMDFDTLEDNTVTIRDRDTIEQERTTVEEIIEFVSRGMEF